MNENVANNGRHRQRSIQRRSTSINKKRTKKRGVVDGIVNANWTGIMYCNQVQSPFSRKSRARGHLNKNHLHVCNKCDHVIYYQCGNIRPNVLFVPASSKEEFDAFKKKHRQHHSTEHRRNKTEAKNMRSFQPFYESSISGSERSASLSKSGNEVYRRGGKQKIKRTQSKKQSKSDLKPAEMRASSVSGNNFGFVLDNESATEMRANGAVLQMRASSASGNNFGSVSDNENNTEMHANNVSGNNFSFASDNEDDTENLDASINHLPPTASVQNNAACVIFSCALKGGFKPTRTDLNQSIVRTMNKSNSWRKKRLEFQMKAQIIRYINKRKQKAADKRKEKLAKKQRVQANQSSRAQVRARGKRSIDDCAREFVENFSPDALQQLCRRLRSKTASADANSALPQLEVDFATAAEIREEPEEPEIPWYHRNTLGARALSETFKNLARGTYLSAAVCKLLTFIVPKDKHHTLCFSCQSHCQCVPENGQMKVEELVVNWLKHIKQNAGRTEIVDILAYEGTLLFKYLHGRMTTIPRGVNMLKELGVGQLFAIIMQQPRDLANQLPSTAITFQACFRDLDIANLAGYLHNCELRNEHTFMLPPDLKKINHMLKYAKQNRPENPHQATCTCHKRPNRLDSNKHQSYFFYSLQELHMLAWTFQQSNTEFQCQVNTLREFENANTCLFLQGALGCNINATKQELVAKAKIAQPLTVGWTKNDLRTLKHMSSTEGTLISEPTTRIFPLANQPITNYRFPFAGESLSARNENPGIENLPKASVLELTALIEIAALSKKRISNYRDSLNPFEQITSKNNCDRKYWGYPAYHELAQWFRFAVGLKIVGRSYQIAEELDSINEKDILAWIVYSGDKGIRTCNLKDTERMQLETYFTERTAKKLAWTVHYNRDAQHEALGRFGRACRRCDLPKGRILNYLTGRDLGVAPSWARRDVINASWLAGFDLPAKTQKAPAVEPFVTQPDTDKTKPEMQTAKRMNDGVAAFFKQRKVQ